MNSEPSNKIISQNWVVPSKKKNICELFEELCGEVKEKRNLSMHRKTHDNVHFKRIMWSFHHITSMYTHCVLFLY